MPRPKRNDRNLVVMSVNMWGLAEWDNRKDVMVHALRPRVVNTPKGPHVFIAVQEANLSHGTNTLEELALSLGYSVEDTRAVPGTGVGFITNGNIMSWKVHDLTDEEGHPLNFGRRVVIITRVRFRRTEVVFACTHLTVNPEMQTTQAREIQQKIQEATGKNNTPVVIVGDLNADPSSEAYYYLTRKMGYVDALVNPQRRHAYSWPVSTSWYEKVAGNDWFRRSQARWVDHILIKGLQVNRAFTAGHTRKGRYYPSDHLLVGAFLLLPLTP